MAAAGHGAVANAGPGSLTTGYNTGILSGNQLVTTLQIPVNVAGNGIGILGWGSGASA